MDTSDSKILKKQIKIKGAFPELKVCQLFGNLMLFPLNVVQEGLDLLDLRIEDLLEELWGELLADGEFIGSLDGLVEVTTKPAEFLLMLQIEVCIFSGVHPLISLAFSGLN